METQGAICELCGGTGWVLEAIEGRKQARPCTCRAEVLRRERLEAAEIPVRYRDDNFANFDEQTPALVSAK